MTDRCPSTTFEYRCTLPLHHDGSHQSGSMYWRDYTIVPATVAEPCGATIRVQPQRWAAHACTRTSDHDGAHGDGVLLWCDPLPIPQAASNNTDYEGWEL